MVAQSKFLARGERERALVSGNRTELRSPILLTESSTRFPITAKGDAVISWAHTVRNPPCTSMVVSLDEPSCVRAKKAYDIGNFFRCSEALHRGVAFAVASGDCWVENVLWKSVSIVPGESALILIPWGQCTRKTLCHRQKRGSGRGIRNGANSASKACRGHVDDNAVLPFQHSRKQRLSYEKSARKIQGKNLFP